MGQGQRDERHGIQDGEEGQEAIKCGWEGGQYHCHKGQVGQSEWHAGQTEGSQEKGSAQQSGRSGQACSGCPGQMGQGQSGREDKAVNCGNDGVSC
jgi:hypothetical protein